MPDDFLKKLPKFGWTNFGTAKVHGTESFGPKRIWTNLKRTEFNLSEINSKRPKPKVQCIFLLSKLSTRPLNWILNLN